jgi:arsenate reductase
MSAGTNPASEVSPTVIQAMKEGGIDISSNRPKKLTVEMLDQADKIITMGCGAENVCPASFAETEDWELEDPKRQSIEKIREIREQIKIRVEKLIKEMQI